MASTALDIMLEFAERTGLISDRAPVRYLWTDAFAVCNFLTLGRHDLAARLIEQVHLVLGRHREDDPRQGWLSGLADDEGAQHPTIGGLRIGKPLAERRPDEPYDARLEWERDGQYFHYLTKWMHALDQAARFSGEQRYGRWARELADSAHGAFIRPTGMAWKMSVDLTRPLVPSMGQHDPLDGYVTAVQLDWTAHAMDSASGPMLAGAATDFAALMPATLGTADALGIGGLLTDAWRVEQLTRHGTIKGELLRDRLIDAAADGIPIWLLSGEADAAAGQRLAFRELGLAIGLAAAERMATAELPPPSMQALAGHLPLRRQLTGFWAEPANRRNSTWLEHRDINEVMLATALEPAGFLDLRL